MVFEWRDAPVADYAVIGNPVDHSLSPRMHTAIYEELSLPYRYVAVRVEPGEVSESLKFLAARGYSGVNVTVPHKKEVLEWAVTIEPFALEVQAANTVDLKSQSCINTDAPGFLKTLERFEIKSRSALVLGAGGSARALIATLSKLGWKIRLYNRTMSKARELAAPYGVEVVSSADPSEAGLILNTTSSAFDGESPPVLWDRAEPGSVAYDLMYSKQATPFLQEAQRVGLRCVDGLPLLVAQGALSFEWWTGLCAPLIAMEKALVSLQ